MNHPFKHSVAGFTLLALLSGMGGMASAQVGGTITRSVAPILISAPLTPAAWNGHWAEKTVTNLIAQGLLGTHLIAKNQTPETQVTVATAADLLLTIGRYPVAADRNVIDQAVELGVIQPSDFADGQIDAQAPVSRERFALWTARATGQKMMAEYAMIYMTPNFKDVDQIGAKFRNAVALLQNQGILAGDENALFTPQRTLTLAEGAQILANTRAVLNAQQAKAEGKYAAELPAASSPGRSVTLELKADGSFVLATDYQKGDGVVVQTGSWRPEHAGMLSLELSAQGGEALERPVHVSARLTEKGLNLMNEKLFGQEAMQLVRQ